MTVNNHRVKIEPRNLSQRICLNIIFYSQVEKYTHTYPFHSIFTTLGQKLPFISSLHIYPHTVYSSRAMLGTRHCVNEANNDNAFGTWGSNKLKLYTEVKNDEFQKISYITATAKCELYPEKLFTSLFFIQQIKWRIKKIVYIISGTQNYYVVFCSLYE